MKHLNFLFLLIASLQNCFAQTDTFHYYLDLKQNRIKEVKYGYHGKVYKADAADSFWKLDEYRLPGNEPYATGWSKDAQGEIKQGDFKYFGRDKSMIRSGRYNNNKKEGQWDSWHSNGKISGRYFFHNGLPVGDNLTWYESGKVRDSALFDNEGNGHITAYHESGQVKFTGKIIAGLKTGLWEYNYDLPGSPKSMEANFVADSMQSCKCFTQEGENQKKNCVMRKDGGFPGGEMAWRDYIKDKTVDMLFAEKIKVDKEYKVVMRFVINGEGKITELKVLRSGGNEKLDKLAEKIIASSPDWEPSYQYNQPSGVLREQPVVFQASR